MWSFMLWIWYQVWGVWCIPISSYFVYLVLLIPPWITGKSEQQIRKQEEVSAFVSPLAFPQLNRPVTLLNTFGFADLYPRHSLHRPSIVLLVPVPGANGHHNGVLVLRWLVSVT